ncbi:hypothetical protein [Zavarzinella formosa]|uniref:hypothetical protein n=1 Tax=Zavarzinella formosa TaxID=360055 RepID=UPI0002EBC13D|nr:hypothetical protein [Zavarzinella formosa]
MRVISQTDEKLVARHHPVGAWVTVGIACALMICIGIVINVRQPNLFAKPYSVGLFALIAMPIILKIHPVVTLTLDRATAEVRVERKYLFGRRLWTGSLEDLTGIELERIRVSDPRYNVFRPVLMFEKTPSKLVNIEDSDENLEQVQEAVGRFIRLARLQQSRS